MSHGIGSFKTFIGPRQYVQGPGAINMLGDLTRELSQRPLLIADRDVLPFVQPSLDRSFPDGASRVLAFHGEVTWAAIEQLAEQGRSVNADAVIGIGGGKGLDAAKGAALKLELPFIAVPTIASNDSPTGRTMAVYDENHAMIAVDAIPNNPLLVLVDTALIANAPARFLRAGMGDALAKKFEAERSVVDGARNFLGGRATLMVLAVADACYRTLRRHGEAAMCAAERHEPDEAFEAVVEANILMAGLSWESGGVSYAHALVRGLVKARGAAQALHGDHVAYGTLVQLAIEGRDDAEIRDVMVWCEAVGLPTRLEDMGMTAPTRDEIAEIARLTTVGPKGGKIVVAKSIDDIESAILRVEGMSAPVAA